MKTPYDVYFKSEPNIEAMLSIETINEYLKENENYKCEPGSLYSLIS